MKIAKIDSKTCQAEGMESKIADFYEIYDCIPESLILCQTAII